MTTLPDRRRRAPHTLAARAGLWLGCALALVACGGPSESSGTESSGTETAGSETPPAETTPTQTPGPEVTTIECELEGVGTLSIAAPPGSQVRPNQTGCVVFLGQGSDPATADLVSQWGLVPGDAESAAEFVRREGMLGAFEVVESGQVSFLGSQTELSHVTAPNPPGIGEPREGWIVWAPREPAHLMALILCRPGESACAASAEAMVTRSE